jgi:hypothetical protein
MKKTKKLLSVILLLFYTIPYLANYHMGKVC